MRKFKKLSAVLLSVVLLLSCMTITAYAAERETQDGLSAVIETDKESYDANEPILVTVTVTNNNSFAVKNVSIESILPASLTISDGTLKSDTVNLEAGQELTLTFTAVLEKDVPPVTEPGTSEPDTSEPGTSEPDTTDPTVTDPSEPPTSEPDTTEPGTSEPDTTEPVVTEPSTSEPDTTEPAVTNPTTQPTSETPTAAGEVTTTEEQTTLTPEITTAVNAADHVNGTSPITGAPAVALKVLFVVVMVAAVAFAVVMLTRKNGKKATKIISVVLSAVIGVSALATTGMIAKAEENTKSLSANKVITIDGEDYVLNAKINYSESKTEETEPWYQGIDEEHVAVSETGVKYIDNRVIIIFYLETTEEQKEAVFNAINGKVIGINYDYTEYQVEITQAKNLTELRDFCDNVSAMDGVQYCYYEQVYEPSDLLCSVSDDILPESGTVPKDLWTEAGGEAQNWFESSPSGNNWGVEAIQAPSAWNYNNRFSSIKIGVVDNGFDTNHEDLNITVVNPEQNDNDGDYVDGDGSISHGTMTSGIIGATANNGHGITGIVWNKELYGADVLATKKQKDKYISILSVFDGIEELIKRGCKVINMSLGNNDKNALVNDEDIYTEGELAVAKIVEWKNKYGNNFLIVQAAGNWGVNSVRNGRFSSITVESIDRYFEEHVEDAEKYTRYDIYANFMIVGAIEQDGNQYKLCEKDDPSDEYEFNSNYGYGVSIVAPGYKVYTCSRMGMGDKKGNYTSASGTSLAAPMVTGVAALVWSINPNFSAEEVNQIVCTSTDKTASSSSPNDDRNAYPIVNAKLAVEEAIRRTDLGTVTGTVKDKETDAPISGVTLEVIDNSDGNFVIETTTTNEDGGFSLSLPAGSYSVSFNHPNYVYHGISLTVEQDATTMIMEPIYLTPKNTEDPGFAGGDGTIENPYQVSTPAQLNAVRNDLDAHYIQINDIDMSDWGNWDPIGNAISIWGGAIGDSNYKEPVYTDNYFTGVYDGNNYSISNLTLDDNKISVTEDCFGLFAGLKNATVKNLNLFNIDYNIDKETTDYSSYWINQKCEFSLSVGGIAGRSDSSTIENCSVTGKINVINCSDAYVGGIAGIGASTNCMSNVNIYIVANKDSRFEQDAYIQCGGIIGHSYAVNAKTSYCTNYGSIEVIASGSVICGGISGNDGYITNCVNYGDICGSVTNSRGIARNGIKYMCPAANSSVGGIIGATSSEVMYCVNYGNVKSSSHTKSITSNPFGDDNKSFAGGIAGWCGYFSSGSISDSYNYSNSIESFADSSEESNISSYAYSGRVAGYSIKISDCYSVNTTTLNGTFPTENMQADRINGASLTKEEMEEKIVQIDFGNMPT